MVWVFGILLGKLVLLYMDRITHLKHNNIGYRGSVNQMFYFFIYKSAYMGSMTDMLLLFITGIEVIFCFVLNVISIKLCTCDIYLKVFENDK